ncbi:MAG: peptide chain release factor N(5)-glutamine methyltransferase [Proteobacteria bacterium]|nr:peptide chain release factor N(5)-glutamine methyltransferase [Pseudomonadota bacterium]MDA1057491.1 peptide chain release factor N(5)-glutamine methyltransferase [Pseudomonadota bacterium]
MSVASAGTVENLLVWGGQALSEHGVANARREARLIFRQASDVSLEDMVSGRTVAVSDSVVRTFKDYVRRRTAGEPLSRIRGSREFWSLDFDLSPATLDPRPDSECLVAAVVANLQRRRIAAPRILDLGTGSGCLLLALVSEVSGASGIGIDLSGEAVVTARRNATKLGLADRANFAVGDWGASIGERFDVVVVNPPYIATAAIAVLADEVRAFDPTLALDGGEDGLACYRTIAPQLGALVAESGFAALEIGMGQSAAVSSILACEGFGAIKVWPDLAGTARCIIAASGG